MGAVRRVRPGEGFWGLGLYGRALSSPYASQDAIRRRHVISLETLEIVAEEMAAMSETLDVGRQALADCFEKLPEGKRQL